MFEFIFINSKYALFWLVILLSIAYVYFKFVLYNYWYERGVPVMKPSVPFGNLNPVLFGKISLGNLIKHSYEQFKNHRYHGLYFLHRPCLIINDPELIKLVLVKEFNKFLGRGIYSNGQVDPMSESLFNLTGPKWKRLRTKFTPTFTSNKLKQMFPLLRETGEELIKVADDLIKDSPTIDVKDLISRFTADSTSSVFFGYNCNSLRNADTKFCEYLQKSVDQNPLIFAMLFFIPSILDLLRIPVVPSFITKFFIQFVSDITNQRREDHNVRNDFLNLIIQLMDIGYLREDKVASRKPEENMSNLVSGAEDTLNLEEATAQIFVFFLGGFETSSSTITYCLYELAKTPNIQEKLQNEIDEIMQDSEGLTYDKLLNDSSYLHMVLHETLRMHPPFPFINRTATEDFKVPNSNLCIKKETSIIVSVSGIHRDPKYYKDPNTFDPERFTKENMAKRPAYTYLPFGEGPRICIGSRLAIIQVKLAIALLVANYNVNLTEETSEFPAYSKNSFLHFPEKSVFLKFEKRILSESSSTKH